MPTTKTRINVSVSNPVSHALEQLAKRDNTPTATKAARLIEIGLELEEDQVWDSIAHERDTAHAKFVLHDNAWS